MATIHSKKVGTKACLTRFNHLGIKDTHFLKFEVKFDVRFPQKAEMWTYLTTAHISTVFI